MGEIDLKIESLSVEAARAEDPADAIEASLEQLGGEPLPEISGNWETTWCSAVSAVDESAYRALLGKKRAAAVFADPPYNVPIDGNVSGLGAIRHREARRISGGGSVRPIRVEHAQWPVSPVSARAGF